MSLQLPRPADLPSGGAASKDNATISRKGRQGVGIMLMIVGALNAVPAIVGIAAYGRYLALVTENVRNEALITIAFGVLLILAMLGIGIWNLATKNTIIKAPLVAALVVTGISVVLDVVSIVSTLMATGNFQGYIVVALEIFVVVQAVRVLRLKPAAVTASAALYATPPADAPDIQTSNTQHL
ncbi:hypothetical protein [Arthrobacter sp. YN]|uniref:hypothetical protein n=1 Tax=Arthrobacter sp. YN TaxID=2020486 RepID=UPI000B5E98FB|nr:hypothetical protein [Arthrobacter sp. YN]ASN19886.1 hypothetical protein CGK93_09525 [Arthrobacter sp. YN]